MACRSSTPIKILLVVFVDLIASYAGPCRLYSVPSLDNPYLKADCRKTDLKTTPQNLPGDTHVLDLAMNNIFDLGDSLNLYSQLDVLSIGCNPLKTLKADNFLNLTSLEELNVNNNENLRNLRSDVFSYLPNLKSLNMACSRHVGFSSAIETLANAPFTLDTLILDGVVKIYDYVILTEDTFNFTSLRELKRLSLRHNNIINMDIRFLLPLTQLEHINIGYNSIIKLLPDDSWGCLIDVIACTNIITLDASDIFSNPWAILYCAGCHSDVAHYFKEPRYSVTDLSSVTSENNSHVSKWCNADANTCGEVTWYPYGTPMPNSLRYVYASGISLWQSGRIFKGSHYRENNFQYLNISGFRMNGFSGFIYGWNSLEVLDASHCGLSFLPTGFLTKFPNLRILIIAHNNFTDINPVIAHVTNLEILDISNNKIVKLNRELFLGFHRIKELYVSGNLLYNLNLRLSDMTSLIQIDMSYNQIQRFENAFITELDQLSNLTEFEISFLGNPLMCTCESLPFVSWLKKNLNGSSDIKIHNDGNLHCLYKNTTDTLIDTIDITELTHSCTTKIELIENLLKTILAPLLTIIIAVIFAAVLCYRLRWQIWWEWHVTFRHFVDIRQQVYTYHTFVACNDSTEASYFIQELQQKTGEYIHSSKDIGHNEPELEANGRMMEASRQIVFLVDQDFVANLSQWELLVPSVLESRSLKRLALVLLSNVSDADLHTSYVLWRLCKSDRFIGYYSDQCNNYKVMRKLGHFLKSPHDCSPGDDMSHEDVSGDLTATENDNFQVELVEQDAPLTISC